jgi:hypothetical protein
MSLVFADSADDSADVAAGCAAAAIDSTVSTATAF